MGQEIHLDLFFLALLIVLSLKSYVFHAFSLVIFLGFLPLFQHHNINKYNSDLTFDHNTFTWQYQH